MYLQFYGLSEKPFSQTPDPRFLYWNDAYRETLASLRYGIQERKGFIAMIGEAGTGKTTLLRKLLDDLGPDIMSVFLFNPNATFEEILEYTLGELGITAPAGRKLAMMQRLNEFLLAAFAEGRNVILLIDEAQDLERDVLESLRLLSNLETAEEKILQIVLSGQPELADKLADPSLRQLKQRIAVRCRLEPLKRSELESYIAARLAVVGGAPDLFLPETLEPIWQFTAGIPRLINTVCDNALLLGYALGKRSLDGKLVCEVIADLGQLDVIPGAIVRPAPAAAIVPEAPSPAAPPPPPPPVAEVQVSAPVELSPDLEAKAPLAEPELAPISASSVPRDREDTILRPEPTQRRRVPWILAAALAGALLLLVGAWMGRSENATLERAGVPASEPLGAPAIPDLPPAVIEQEAAALHEESLGSPDEAAPAGDAAPAEEPAPVAEAPPPAAEAAPPEPAPADRAETVAQNDSASAQPLPDGEAEPPPAPARAEPNGDTIGSADIEAPPSRPDASRVEMARAAEPAEEENPEDPTEEPPPAAMARLDPDEFLARSRTRPPPASDAGPQAARSVGGAAPREGGVVPVRPGDTLLDLAIAKYGTANLTTLDMLQGRNPEIRSMDLIIAGSGLVFPDPGPESRIVDDENGYTVLAMTTSRLADAVQMQNALESRLQRPVSLQRVNRDGNSVYRVSVRGLPSRDQASQVAQGLGSVLRDPEP